MASYAVVGTDGTREVVWGIGATEEEARQDAERYLDDAQPPVDPSELTVHEITEAQAEVVRAGDVSWPVKVPS